MTPQELSESASNCASLMFKAGLEFIGQEPGSKIPLTQDQIAVLDQAISLLVQGPLAKLRRIKIAEQEPFKDVVV